MSSRRRFCPLLQNDSALYTSITPHDLWPGAGPSLQGYHTATPLCSLGAISSLIGQTDEGWHITEQIGFKFAYKKCIRAPARCASVMRERGASRAGAHSSLIERPRKLSHRPSGHPVQTCRGACGVPPGWLPQAPAPWMGTRGCRTPVGQWSRGLRGTGRR